MSQATDSMVVRLRIISASSVSSSKFRVSKSKGKSGCQRQLSVASFKFQNQQQNGARSFAPREGVQFRVPSFEFQNQRAKAAASGSCQWPVSSLKINNKTKREIPSRQEKALSFEFQVSSFKIKGQKRLPAAVVSGQFQVSK